MIHLAMRMFLLVPLVGSCSFQRLAVDQTAGILAAGIPSFEREGDFELARQAAPANVKMVEGLLASAPDNPQLLSVAAKGLTAYALLFVEDEWEQAEPYSERANQLAARIRNLYLRAHRYGLELLEQTQPGFTAALARGGSSLAAELDACDRDDVQGLYWTSVPLAGAVNFGGEDLAVTQRLPQAMAMVLRLAQLDPGYYHGTAAMAAGALLGATGSALGGDTVESEVYFEKALKQSQRRYLMVQVVMAKTLAVALEDRQMFQHLLQAVLSAEDSTFPEQRLANLAAKRRARRLLAAADELF